MKELLRTNDLTTVAYAKALLSGENIRCFELDANTSVLEGSIGILPRRLMVVEGDLAEAQRVMHDNGLESQ